MNDLFFRRIEDIVDRGDVGVGVVALRKMHDAGCKMHDVDFSKAVLIIIADYTSSRIPVSDRRRK